MASTILADSPQSETTRDPDNQRALRGMKLFEERGDEIEPLGQGRYHVPASLGNGHDPYTVDLGIFHDEPEHEFCTCRDFQHRKETCKHLIAASIYRAKARQREHAKIAERKQRQPKRSAAEVFAGLERMGVGA